MGKAQAFPPQKKVAFTLAEVLITLGIIGGVAALTLPALVGKYKKAQTVSQLQKVYTILNQALKNSEVDNGDSINWELASWESAIYFEKYWKPYLKIQKVCNTAEECGYTSNRPWSRVNNSKDPFDVILKNYRVAVILSDGTFVSFFTAGGINTDADEDKNQYTFSETPLILVDINGGRKPNQFGRDVFFLIRANRKGVRAYGYDDEKETILQDCSRNNLGYKCLSKILMDGWEIKDDYPW